MKLFDVTFQLPTFYLYLKNIKSKVGGSCSSQNKLVAVVRLKTSWWQFLTRKTNYVRFFGIPRQARQRDAILQASHFFFVFFSF